MSKKSDEPIYLEWATYQDIADELAKRQNPYLMIWGKSKECIYELSDDPENSIRIGKILALWAGINEQKES